jgi:tetratricopeptide (TPR) repeat protein
MDGTVAEALASLQAQIGDLTESLFMGKLGTALGGVGPLAELVPPDFPSFDWAFLTIKEKPLLAQARLCLASGKLPSALEKARQHVALYPDDWAAREFYAANLLRAGTASAAVDTLAGIERGGDMPASRPSLYARCLAAIGEPGEALDWHETALSLAPEDAAVAAAQIGDAPWLDRDAQIAAAGWIARFCQPAKARQWQPPQDKLVIAYVVPGFADSLDREAVAAVAQAHDRARVKVLAYGTGAQSWPENATLSGAFDAWHDIATLDSPTLARYLARGGAHLIVDAAGFAAPTALAALARVGSALRVSWLGNPAGVGAPLYDAAMAEIAGLYPILSPVRQVARMANRNFGADVGMAQLDEATVKLWSAVLEAQPDAKLLLRARDMGPGRNIDRLIDRFGRALAARIDIVDDRTEEFYAAVSVAVLPRRGVSARAAAEAIACRVPALALADAAPYAAFLRGQGLASLVLRGAKRFVAQAGDLMDAAEKRAQLLAARPAQTDGAYRFALALEERARQILSASEAA